MGTSMKTIGRITRPALTALAALALLNAAVSGAQAAPQPELTPASQIARHFQHEDALYAARPTNSQTRSPAQAMALHFQHEDALYGARQEIPRTRTPAQMIALHFQHEDTLYRAPASASGPLRSSLAKEAAAGDDFDWGDALVGAGSAVAVLLLGAAAALRIRRHRSLPVLS